jgi:hypothetical protein
MADITNQRQDSPGCLVTRLDFDTDLPASTVLEGVWWPRTRESARELAGLIAALDARRAPVGLIMLNPHGWLGHPHRIDTANRTVRIAWTADLDTAAVIGTTAPDRRIDLLLVLPRCDDGADPDAPATADDTNRLPVPATPAPRRTLCGSMSATMLTLATNEGESSSAWIDGVRGALLMLRTDLQEHRDVTSGPLGTHRRILGMTPRLSKAVADLDREQADIARLLNRALAGVAGPTSAIHVDRVRAEGLALLRRLTRYQQRGADMVHEADQVDLGRQG